MAAKDKVVKHVDDVVGVVLVLLAQVFQDPDLLLGLPVEPFLVAHHLEGDVKVTLVVVGLDDLTEAALPDDFEHFVAVGQVVVSDVRVRALVVVVATVVGAANEAGPLFGIGPNEVDLGVVEDLMVFVWSQFVHVQFHHLERMPKIPLIQNNQLCLHDSSIFPPGHA
jgi:hypothetical protein